MTTQGVVWYENKQAVIINDNLISFIFCPLFRIMSVGADPGFDEGGSDKRPPKALDPRGCGDMLPRKIFNFGASEMQFSGAISSGLIALKSPPFLC